MKKCKDCKVEKIETDFYPHPKKHGQVINSCKKCVIKRVGDRNKNNKEKRAKYQKKYYSNNKENILKKVRERDNYKRKNDNIYRLKYNLSHNLRLSLKSRNLQKKNKTSNLLKCSFEELIIHLNNNKYGFVYGDKSLDIDHIIPTSRCVNIEELEELYCYTNLQLLPSFYNRYIKKNNKFNKKHFEEWLKTYKK